MGLELAMVAVLASASTPASPSPTMSAARPPRRRLARVAASQPCCSASHAAANANGPPRATRRNACRMQRSSRPAPTHLLRPTTPAAHEIGHVCNGIMHVPRVVCPCIGLPCARRSRGPSSTPPATRHALQVSHARPLPWRPQRRPARRRHRRCRHRRCRHRRCRHRRCRHHHRYRHRCCRCCRRHRHRHHRHRHCARARTAARAPRARTIGSHTRRRRADS